MLTDIQHFVLLDTDRSQPNIHSFVHVHIDRNSSVFQELKHRLFYPPGQATGEVSRLKNVLTPVESV